MSPAEAPAARDLLTDPLWQEHDLGAPIPDSPDACSVALPLWRHVVGYEEADPAIIGRLRCGYPRFFFHPAVTELMAAARERLAGPGEIAYVFPSRAAAEQCASYVRDRARQAVRTADFGACGIHAVVGPAEAEPACKEFWQHAGPIVSSRLARAALHGNAGTGATGHDVRATLRARVAEHYGAAPDDVFLCPSGMAAIHAATQVASGLNPGRRVQLEFPYIDTLKLHERFAGGAAMYAGGGGDSEDDGRALADRLRRDGPIGLVTTEIPSNPLLRTVPLEAISPLLREQGALLIVDDTIATPVNVDVTPWADLVVVSLTKFFCGSGDAIAGAVVIGPRSPHRETLRDALSAQHEDLLWHEDAEALEAGSRDFEPRVRRINETASSLARYLRGHPAVDTVWYPEFDSAAYDAIRKPGGGYGGLLSLTLRDPARTSEPFYDSLRVSKGPSLGTNFTLACPYTVIAHYRELDWAESHGVSRWIVRISVGLEDPEDLRLRFERALAGGG